jgi:malate dehydrogenase (oxaloacetate-decarboxylating)
MVPVSRRPGGSGFDAFIARYVATASQLFPDALLHFQDLGYGPARKITQAYSDRYRVFSADLHGTGAAVLAAIYAASRGAGIPMKHQELVVFSTGAAGASIADQLHDAIGADGATSQQARSQIWVVERQDLLCDTVDRVERPS